MNVDSLLESLSPETIIPWLTAVGLKIVAALLTFLIGRWIAKLMTGAIQRGLERSKADQTLINFIGHISYGLLMALVVISALGQLGVSTTSAAALIGGAGIAIGLSLKDQLSAFAAGVMLIMFRPFKRGDFIEGGGVTGTVEEIKIVATILKTPNNQEVTVPNNNIWGSNITNYSARAQRRIDLPVGIAYDADFRKAKDILLDIASQDERILKDPAVWLGVTDLGDSAVVISFRPWVNTGDYWQVRSELIEQIKLRFDEAGIGIPFPQMDVHLHKEEA